MDLRQIYGDIAKQIVQSRDKDFESDLGLDSVITCLFFKSVQIEKVLISDSEREIRKALASFTFVVLDNLEYWNKDWCLRSPKFSRGKFLSPYELTAPIRFCLADINLYRNQGISKDVCTVLELLLKQCIELSYKLDFDLAMSLFEYIREIEV